jgi:hypothetical protein
LVGHQYVLPADDSLFNSAAAVLEVGADLMDALTLLGGGAIKAQSL